jgi:hypothetical protein
MPAPIAIAGAELSSNSAEASSAMMLEAAKKPALMIAPSRARPAARLTIPARSVSASRRGRKRRRLATRSTTPSRRCVVFAASRARSSSRPTPWAATAARTSGASAIRSTSFCTSSLASSRSQTRSIISLSIA